MEVVHWQNEVAHLFEPAGAGGTAAGRTVSIAAGVEAAEEGRTTVGAAVGVSAHGTGAAGGQVGQDAALGQDHPLTVPLDIGGTVLSQDVGHAEPLVQERGFLRLFLLGAGLWVAGWLLGVGGAESLACCLLGGTFGEPASDESLVDCEGLSVAGWLGGEWGGTDLGH